MLPSSAITCKDIIELSHDNIKTVNGWSLMLCVDALMLFPPGDRGIHYLIPREDFDELVDWYTKGMVPKGDKR